MQIRGLVVLGHAEGIAASRPDAVTVRGQCRRSIRPQSADAFSLL